MSAIDMSKANALFWELYGPSIMAKMEREVRARIELTTQPATTIAPHTKEIPDAR